MHFEQMNYDEILDYFDTTLPKFDDGRIDYTGAKISFVLNAFVHYNGQLLLLKRSKKVGSYHGKWNGVAGYLDEKKSLEMKVYGEIEEEIQVKKDNIEKVVP